MGTSTISMAIFHSYVKLPEGNLKQPPQSQKDTESVRVSTRLHSPLAAATNILRFRPTSHKDEQLQMHREWWILCPQKTGKNIWTCAGWWYAYPTEKYESQLG